MQINLKYQVIIKAICLMVIMGLCFAVYLHGKELSCDKCSVKFISRNSFGDKDMSIWIMDLHDELKEGNCYVKWDEQSGFFIDKSK